MNAIEVQNEGLLPCPADDALQQWAEAAIDAGGGVGNAELTLRIVAEDEMAALNNQYRGVARPTNVLAFPAALPEELKLPLLGDIVICTTVVEREASKQNKPCRAHWAHMVVHGTLHLLGYDHQCEKDAAIMERMETEILQKLLFAAPYEQPPAARENQQP